VLVVPELVDRLLVLLAMSALVLAAGPASQGRAAAGPDSLRGTTVPIADVRGDADDDWVPDRRGDTVTVAGRVAAGKNRLAVPVPNLISLHDSTGGIHVVLPGGPSVARGDSLWVRGVVEQEYGLTQLRGVAYGTVDGTPRSPTPIPLTVHAAASERYEGRLARVRGRIRTKGSNDGGDFLRLGDREGDTAAQITVFVADQHMSRLTLDVFEEGDEVKVTGVIGQHDFEAPYSEYYQLEPRTQKDLARIGGLPPYLWTIVFILGGGGLLAVVAVFVLRAAVRRRTQELAQSRARFRRLAEATSEGIVLHEEDGTIVDINAAFADMVGQEASELMGQQVSAVLPHDRVTAAQAANGTEASPVEAELEPEHGPALPVEIEEGRVTAGAGTVHVCAVRDISKRKEWEAEILLAKKEAEQMAQLKSTLLNNMSHELRTPVTNITGYAELIMEEADDPHKKFASHIRKSGKRLSETLQAVLDMAQIEAGTLDVLVRDVRVENVVQEILDRHDPRINEKGIAVQVDVPEMYTLRTDRTLLYRILDNLIQNAVKFTEAGTIGIEGRPTSLGMHLVVWDTGVGIAPSFQPDLFDPFKQESEGLAREYEGSGLGLTLTKRMVDILGGTIEVESTKGEGSAFTVALTSLPEAETPVLEEVDEGEVSRGGS
jgi:PAS domain S-box-containing protein